MKINPLLFPDICYSQYDQTLDEYKHYAFYPNFFLNSNTTNSCFSLSELPICRLFQEKIKRQGECVFLTGTGSIGKSTNLRILKLYLLKEKTPYYYLNVSDINPYRRSEEFEEENVQGIIALSNSMGEPLVVILDAYDEVQTNSDDLKKLQIVNAMISKLIEETENIACTIIASRYMPDSTLFSHSEKTTFIRADIREFSKGQIKEIFKRHDIELETQSPMANLLSNTFFSALFLEALKRDQKFSLSDDGNESTFIQKYFESLYADKNHIISTEKCNKDLIDIGEHISSDMFGQGEHSDWDAILPGGGVLNHIFYLQNNRVVSTQLKFINFALAKFLHRVLIKNLAKNKEVPDEFKLPFHRDTKEAFVFLGQMLKTANELGAMNLLEERSATYTSEYEEFYLNVQYVKIGYHSGILKDFDHLRGGDFFNCQYLFEVESDRVKSVGTQSFYSCKFLRKVNLRNVKEIKYQAFGECARLKYAYIPNCETFEDYVFANCEKLKEIVVNVPKIIGKRPLYGCISYIEKSMCAFNGIYLGGLLIKASENLETFVLRHGTTRIGNGVFKDNKNLKNVYGTDDLEVIQEEACKGCCKLVSIDLSNAKAIEKGAFSSCRRMEMINIPNVTSLGDYVFSRDIRLKNVVMGKVEKIGKQAFMDCRKLRSVDLTGVQEIGSKAFFRSGLVAVTLPESLEKVGKEVFALCDSLVQIRIPRNLNRNMVNELLKDIGEDTTIEFF